MSERAAAVHFGVSRASVKKIMGFSVPLGYRRTAEIKRPKLDGFTGFIDRWLLEDVTANPTCSTGPPMKLGACASSLILSRR